MKEFLAHLHPVLVHLPIGVLLLAAVFAWLGRLERHQPISTALPILLRFGAAAAILSCLTGWLLGGSGEYDPDTLAAHQWLAIATTAVATGSCFLPFRLYWITVAALLLLITGHYGGTLTHGAGYLALANENEDRLGKRPIDVQEASLYADIIATILEEKCNSCHGNTKQKAGLRLDQPNLILKGGKNGVVIRSNDPENSELKRRCLLPLGHEDHMPPQEKPQLSPSELEILLWWLEQGADFQRKAMEVPQTEQVRKALSIWKNNAPINVPIQPDVPPVAIAPASAQALLKLREFGVMVLPVHRGSHWLTVNFENLPKPPDSVFVYLRVISKQILWLNMSGCTVPEGAWSALEMMTNLTRLTLAYSSITDTELLQLKNLEYLHSLNLTHTRITANGLRQIVGLKNLRTLYLYQSAINTSDWMALKAAFPHTRLDTGGYELLLMESDTARLKAPAAY